MEGALKPSDLRLSAWCRLSIGKAIAIAAAMLVAFLAVALVSSAEAKTPIYDFSTGFSGTQAGDHSNLKIDFTVGTALTEPPTPCLCNSLKETFYNSSPGVLAAPSDIPQCTTSQFSNNLCPVDSQIGLVAILLNAPGDNQAVQPLFNMVPRPDQLALTAFSTPVITSPIYTSFSVRTESDYGAEAKTFGIPGNITPYRVTLYFWGIPAEPIHDALRAPFDNWGPFEETNFVSRGMSCGFEDPRPAIEQDIFPEEECEYYAGDPPVPSNSAPTPFLLNPTRCGTPLKASLETRAYDLEPDFTEASLPPNTGCDQLNFDPSLSAKPTTTEADSPSGLDVNLHVPQTLSPSTPSPSQIRETTVRLPEGLTVNSNAADGKLSCSDEQARFGTREEAQCPEFSKIGTLSIKSSSLPGALPGAIYLGEPQPGNRYRLFLVADGFSLHIKLPGTAKLDPVTGQVTTIFKDLPQAPFEDFDFHIFGAERGLLTTPTHCGTYAVHSEFVPWAAPDLPNQTSTQFFKVDSGPGGSPCPPDQRPFDPALEAGVTDNTGGSHTDFVFDISREDGDQSLSAVNVKTPRGFSAILAGIPYCPEAALGALAQSSYLGVTELVSPACAASQVGDAVASAGTGSRPVSLQGRVYLAGPYKGAPLSLAVVTPAVSGPYDLGNVLVRVAVKVDPTSAQVSAVSDPLPQIIEGIPLRLRRVLVELDRPDFALNPTNCSPFSVDALAFGDQGATANLSNHFQVANCGALDFSPRLALKLRGSTKRRGHPALRAVLQANPGDSNIGSTVVAMPAAELLDNAHIGTVCTRVQFAANACPPRSLIGNATAQTPLLDQPLSGPVYLRSSNNDLPDLVVALKGQFDIELVGRIDTTKAGGLRTSFEAIPDAPVSKFVLNLQGGSKGLLINSEDLCKSPKRAAVSIGGQNSMRSNTRTELETSCAKASKKRKRAKHRRAHVSSTRKAG